MFTPLYLHSSFQVRHQPNPTNTRQRLKADVLCLLPQDWNAHSELRQNSADLSSIVMIQNHSCMWLRLRSAIPIPIISCDRYSKDKPRMGEPLEVIKFVCKDFWQAVFKKQVDNLRTNHRVSVRATTLFMHAQPRNSHAIRSTCTISVIQGSRAPAGPQLSQGMSMDDHYNQN